jgi:hypothetical protein
MVFGSLIDKLFGVINYQMFTKALQGLIASKGVRIVDRALAGMVLNMGQKGLRRDRLHHLRIDPAIPLQKAKDDAFASRTSASLTLTSVIPPKK